MLLLISDESFCCCSEAVAICWLISKICATDWLIFSKFLIASPAVSETDNAPSDPSPITLMVFSTFSWNLSIRVLISTVDSLVCLAKLRTSSATTANPRPFSPARAASMAAFNASKLVCSAIVLITSKTEPMSRLLFSNSLITWAEDCSLSVKLLMDEPTWLIDVIPRLTNSLASLALLAALCVLSLISLLAINMLFAACSSKSDSLC